MKEFDKQWQKIAEQMHDAPMFWCKAGWRAALEKVLKQTKRTNRGRIGIIDWIEKELGDA